MWICSPLLPSYTRVYVYQIARAGVTGSCGLPDVSAGNLGSLQEQHVLLTAELGRALI